MKHLLIALLAILVITSCKDNSPKAIVKKAAIENLHSNGINNITVLSVDSITKWSTNGFKKICKEELDKISTQATNLAIIVSLPQYNHSTANKLNTLCNTMMDSINKYIPDLTAAYNKIQAHKDVTAIVYKVTYSDMHNKQDSLFVYGSTDYKTFNFAKEWNTRNIVDEEFTNDVAHFIDITTYFKYLLTGYSTAVQNPESINQY